MMFFKTITIVSSVVAGLCLLALPMWALGVPGTENDYAKGWKMGLQVLLVTPLAWLVIYAPYFVMRNRIEDASRLKWQTILAWLACILLILAAARLIQAFKTML